MNYNIRIWNDPWIPTIPCFKPSQKSSHDLLPLSLNLVKDLMFENSNSWNPSILSSLFLPEVVNEILKIKISSDFHSKHLFWSPSKTESFSTKSAYLTDNSHRFLHNLPNFLGKIFGMLIFITGTSCFFGELFVMCFLLSLSLALFLILMM